MKAAEGAAIAGGSYIVTKAAPKISAQATQLAADVKEEKARLSSQKDRSVKERAISLKEAAMRIREKHRKRAKKDREELISGAASAAVAGAAQGASEGMADAVQGAFSAKTNPRNAKAEISQMLKTPPPIWEAKYEMARSAMKRLGLPVPGPSLTIPNVLQVLRITAEGKNYSGEEPDAPGIVPPREVQEEALHGLRLSHANNYGGDHLIGIARAVLLASGHPLSAKGQERASRYFSRHKVDKQGKNFGNDENPSKGYMAWLNWGGEAGREWLQEIVPSRTASPRRRKNPMTTHYGPLGSYDLYIGIMSAFAGNGANVRQGSIRLRGGVLSPANNVIIQSQEGTDLFAFPPPVYLDARDVERPVHSRSEGMYLSDRMESDTPFLMRVRILDPLPGEQNIDFGFLVHELTEQTAAEILTFLGNMFVAPKRKTTLELLDTLSPAVSFTSDMFEALEPKGLQNPRRMRRNPAGDFIFTPEGLLKLSQALVKSGEVGEFRIIQTGRGMFRIVIETRDGASYMTHSWFTTRENAERRIREHEQTAYEAELRRQRAATGRGARRPFVADIEDDIDIDFEPSVEMTYVPDAVWQGGGDRRVQVAQRNLSTVKSRSVAISTRDYLVQQGNHVGIRNVGGKWEWSHPHSF
jgi:hypothetical protein